LCKLKILQKHNLSPSNTNNKHDDEFWKKTMGLVRKLPNAEGFRQKTYCSNRERRFWCDQTPTPFENVKSTPKGGFTSRWDPARPCFQEYAAAADSFEIRLIFAIAQGSFCWIHVRVNREPRQKQTAGIMLNFARQEPTFRG